MTKLSAIALTFLLAFLHLGTAKVPPPQKLRELKQEIRIQAEGHAIQVIGNAEGAIEVIRDEAGLQVIRGGEVIVNQQAVVQAPAKLTTALPTPTSEQNAPRQQADESDKLHFFDGSSLRGQLLDTEGVHLLRWNHAAAVSPLAFRYSAIQALDLAHRPLADAARQTPPDVPQTLLAFHNGDRFRGNLQAIDGEFLQVRTNFAGLLRIPKRGLASLALLPPSHKILYDSSQGLSGWKPDNPNAWKSQNGELVSMLSGGMSRALPEQDALEVEFDVQWERSFYFGLRMFSDSESRSYNSIGYNVSFSNNRINLQVAKRKNNRLTRETIGNATVNELYNNKKARVKIYGNRTTKEFVIWLNGKEIARWKDADEEFTPSGNNLVFYNQGGSSLMRLRDITISGWNGDLAPVTPPNPEEIKPDSGRITFINGDTATAEIGSLKDGKLALKTKRGTFPTPLDRVRSIHLAPPNPESTPPEKPSHENLHLAHAQGRLSLNLLSIRDGSVSARSSTLGELTIALPHVRRITCNLHLLELEKYLAQLRLARQAIDERNLNSARSILYRANPGLRGWLWGRLLYHVQALGDDELLRFTPHPETGLAAARFAGDSSTLLTIGKDATFHLRNDHVTIASAPIEGSKNLQGELGRFPNETPRRVTITRDFWLGSTEITQAQYAKLLGLPPPEPEKTDLPASNVSWNDAVAYCEKLNERHAPPAGYLYRLPTEAEWEYAARSGSTGPYADADLQTLPPDEHAYRKHLSERGWFAENAENAAHPVGARTPNNHGLHDMHGNLWEWCLDHVGLNKRDMLRHRVPGAQDPHVSHGRWRSLRGGSFNVSFNRCRSAYRGANDPAVTRNDRGFRIALAPDLAAPPEGNATLQAEQPRQIDALGIKLQPIPGGSFIMGSPSLLPGGKATVIPKQDRIITAGTDGSLNLHDLAGRPIRLLDLKLPAPATAIAVSPDGKLLLVAAQDGSAHLLSLPEGKRIAHFQDHQAAITAIAFSPDGKRLATSSLDGSATLRSTQPDSEPTTLKGNESRFDQLHFSPDSRHLLTSGPGSAPSIWNVKDGSHLLHLRIEQEDVVVARFSPDGQAITTAIRSGRLLQSERSTGLVYNVIALPGREPTDLHYSPDGQRILVSFQDGSCSLRNTPRNAAVHILANGEQSLQSSPDYYFNLARHANQSPPITLDAFLAKHDQAITAGKLPPGSARSPDQAWTLTTQDGALRLWRTETGKQEAILADKLAAPFQSCAFTPDGAHVVGRLQSGQILAFPALEHTVSEEKPPPSPSADQLRALFPK